MSLLSQDTVQQQSMAAWNTWREKWKRNCRTNRYVPKGTLNSLVGVGAGKILVQVAMGASLTTDKINLLKKERRRFDIACCDKAFGLLMSNGIIPDYCVIADASVGAEWQNGQDTSKTTLVANIACNPTWSVNWKGPVFFYANWDNIGSAKVLAPLADVYEVIPASSNVSNAQVVFASQILGYDYQLLIGFDYSWRADGTYYAGGDSIKRHYMHHLDVVSPEGYLAMTSSNLYFSCFWMMNYLMKYPQIKVINCSGEGILGYVPRMSLEQALKSICKKENTIWQ